MHFFYVKSNILRKWSNILRKFYVTMFTPEHSLLRRSIPFGPPGPPRPAPDPAYPPHPAAPPPHPAPHPTLPASNPPALPSSTGTTASQALQRACSLLVLLPRRGASQCATSSNILQTLQKFYIPHLKFYTHPPKIYVPYPKIYVPHLKFYITPSNILHKSYL